MNVNGEAQFIFSIRRFFKHISSFTPYFTCVEELFSCSCRFGRIIKSREIEHSIGGLTLEVFTKNLMKVGWFSLNAAVVAVGVVLC